MAWNGLPRGLPWKCYFHSRTGVATARHLKAAGVITGSPCLDRDNLEGNSNMMLARTNLGLIPSWQFDMNPANNPKVVNLDFPPDMYQTTVQPVGPYMNGGGGLGNPWASAPGVRVYAPPRGACPAGTVETSRGCIRPGGGPLAGAFDTWLSNNRMWVAAGAMGIVGAALIVFLAKHT